MVRSTITGLFLALAGSVFVWAPATAGPKEKEKPPPAVVAKWSWTLFDEDDRAVEKGYWVVRGYVMYNRNNKRVGSYEDVATGQVKADITDGRLKGVLEMRREPGSSQWKGTAEKVGGGVYRITATFQSGNY
jgi:hypothetical protein